MEPFSLHTTVTLEDWKAYVNAWALRARASRSRTGGPLLFMVAVLVTALAMAGLQAVGLKVQFPSMIGGVVLGTAIMFGRLMWQSRTATPDDVDSLLGPCDYDFSQEGFRIRRRGIEGSVQWSRIREMDATAEYVFFWLDGVAGHLLPLRDLPDGISKDEFVDRLRALVTGAPKTATAVATKPQSWATVLGRLWTLRTLQGELPVIGDFAIGIAAVVSLGLWVVLDRLRTGPGAEFSTWGVSGVAWAVLETLAAAWALSRFTRPRQNYRTALFLLVAILPLLIGAKAALLQLTPTRWQLVPGIVVFLYALIYVAQGLRSTTGKRQLSALVAALVVAISVNGMRSELGMDARLWYQPPHDDFASSWENSESLLFDQPDKIDGLLANVKPSSSATPGVYFVGFAGVGEQRVFSQEIKLAASRVSARYGSAERTVLLLNDHRDFNSYPLATVAGLGRALSGIAGKMNLDRDVLFLSISSHGSQDPSVSVSNDGLPLRDLTGEALAKALRASGIKWKVIVISACHSGAFIDSLRDNHTVILTAAATDRTSFGCSDDRDLTYFGEAFYRDALPHATSLRDAFEHAKADIEARETREHITPSQPQAFYGAATEEKLAEIEKLNGGPNVQANLH